MTLVNVFYVVWIIAGVFFIVACLFYILGRRPL